MMMRRQGPFGMAPPFAAPEGGHGEPTSRLGAMLATPNATLVEQLALPKGQGLVLEEVPEGTAAAKAGLKPHDILLDIDGKAVPKDVVAFASLLAKIKEDTPVEVIVLRRGKNETLKGLKLPKAEPGSDLGAGDFQRFLPPMPAAPFAPQPLPAFGPPQMMMPPFGGNGVTTTIFRDNDR